MVYSVLHWANSCLFYLENKTSQLPSRHLKRGEMQLGGAPQISRIYSSHKQKLRLMYPGSSIRLGNGSDWPNRAGALLLVLIY